MASLGPAIFQALIAILFYTVPAVSLHLLVGGLANPRQEGWEPTERAHQMKETYRRFVQWGRQLNLLLVSFFLIEVVMFLVLRVYDCAPNASHTSAVAQNIAIVFDRLFQLGILVLLGGSVAGMVWSVRYHLEAKRNAWPDPRRRDHLIVHFLLVPLALLLLFVAFGAVPTMVCPGL